MRFSIILPSHNGEDRIEKALSSIESQTFKDYELIVVCDACDDRTEEIALQHNARVLKTPYRRAGLARNDGIAMAQGEYLMFMDDDDYWINSEVLERVDAKLKETNDALDVLCFAFLFNGMHYADCRDANGSYWTAVWNKCWRRSFVKDCKFSDAIVGSDVAFTNWVLVKKPVIAEWQVPLYIYNHMREGSITETEARRKRGLL